MSSAEAEEQPSATCSKDNCTPPIPHKVVGVALIWNEQGKLLIDRRRLSGPLGGLWEFPGGKIEPGENIQECIKREVREELGVEIAVGEHVANIDYEYPHLCVTLIVHHCFYLSGDPKPIECDEVRWVAVDELASISFPPANQQIIAALQPSVQFG